MNMSFKSTKLKKSCSDRLNSGKAVIQNLSEKMRFSCSVFYQVVQKQYLSEVGK